MIERIRNVLRSKLQKGKIQSFLLWVLRSKDPKQAIVHEVKETIKEVK